ncbi:MAG: NAD(P)-binding protein [Desulfovibrio sp.]|nr:NAD(P)-binding protein [Desulfovibrio sp.]
MFAHEARKKGKSCRVLDRRSHTGGNIHCEQRDGINIHACGARIFHTSDRKV